MSHTLITGGAGFLGINLIRHLLERGLGDITVLDIAELEYPEKERVHLLRADVRDREAVGSAMRGVDRVVHAAAALPLYRKEAIFSTDVDGTRNLLEAAFREGVERFIHISSTAVYGIPDHHPVYEDDPLAGVGPYGKAKILAERLCETYRARGLCLPILRPKSFVGPERLGAFALLYDWAQEGRGFPVIGSGANRYQLLDVEDLCRAIALCLTLDRQAVNDTFNVGAAEFATMREDFQSVLDAAGYGKKVVGFPAWLAVGGLKVLDLLGLSPLYRWVYETAGRDSIVSIEKARDRLGFHPKYSNREALVRNYRWYLENRHRFKNTAGISHRTPWNQGILRVVRRLY
jgi:nucleoside-diphosphate-sugar epimerase